MVVAELINSLHYFGRLFASTAVESGFDPASAPIPVSVEVTVLAKSDTIPSPPNVTLRN